MTSATWRRSACRPAFPRFPAASPDADRLMDLIAQDKKVKRGKLTFILVRGIGESFIAPDVDAAEVRAFLIEKLAEAMNYRRLAVHSLSSCSASGSRSSSPASETALTAFSRARMLRMEKAGNRRAALVNRLLETRERLIGAILTGNNVVNIAASSLATGLLLAWFGDVGVALCDRDHDRRGRGLHRGAAQDRGDQRAGPGRAAGRAADLVGGAAVRTDADRASRRWCAGFCGCSASVSAPTRRFCPRTRSCAAPVDLLHHEGSVEKHDRDMFGGLLDLRDLDRLRRDDPPHRDDHGLRRRSAGGGGQGGA